MGEVNSLYLDSPHLDTFYDWVNANRNRFKLRIRFYDSHPDSPVFLEIKRRVSSCILKQRCKIRKAAAPLVLAGQFPPQDLIVTPDAKAMMALERFIALSTFLHATAPQVVVARTSAALEHVVGSEGSAARGRVKLGLGRALFLVAGDTRDR